MDRANLEECSSFNPFWREDWEIKMIENSKLKTYYACIVIVHMIMKKSKEMKRKRSLECLGHY